MTFFVWQESHLADMRDIINTSYVREDREDYWTWVFDTLRVYSTKYALLLLQNQDLISSSHVGAVNNIFLHKFWSGFTILSKIAIFNWQLTLNRLPTMLNLVRRNISSDIQ